MLTWQHFQWDAGDPIGNIVQGHTNLTEIQQATELFWRVSIPPSKIVIGFGFYGRAFSLADPKCSKPGCRFKGPSKPGPCTATGGYLAYYEIMDIISAGGSRKRATIEPTLDEKSGVNYLTFDRDQWVSYDDKMTFKQKTDWANNIGFGGGLIWASDQGKHVSFLGYATLCAKAIRILARLDLFKDFQKVKKLKQNESKPSRTLVNNHAQKKRRSLKFVGKPKLTKSTDDDKFSAHTALLGQDVHSTSTLMDEDKALSMPQTVVHDLAGSNGQNCFAYQGESALSKHLVDQLQFESIREDNFCTKGMP